MAAAGASAPDAGRPDVLVARLAIAEAQARLEAIRRENSPTLNLQSDLVQRNSTVAFPGTQYSAGVTLAWPLLDGGASKARSQATEAEIRELQAQAEEALRLAELDQASLQSELEARQSAWRSAARVVAAAEEADRAARLRYENGLSTATESLDSALGLSRARRELSAARYNLASTELRLQRARGQAPGAADGL